VKSDDSEVYESAFFALQYEKNTLPIYYKTSLSVFKRIDFKKTDVNKWLGTGSVKNCKSFFERINLDTIKETNITSNIGAHPITTKMYEEDIINHRAYPFFTLSPIIYSSDKALALCSIAYWGNRDDASETILLLAFKEGKWLVVKYLPVSFS